MMNLNLINHPVCSYNPNFVQYRGGGRGGGVGGRFKNMDYILLIVGVVVFIAASAISGVVTPYLEGVEGAADFITYIPLFCQIGGGIAVIAALAGKRVFM